MEAAKHHIPSLSAGRAEERLAASRIPRERCSVLAAPPQDAEETACRMREWHAVNTQEHAPQAAKPARPNKITKTVLRRRNHVSCSSLTNSSEQPHNTLLFLIRD